MALILTETGETALQEAQANNTALTISYAKIGSAQYTPDGRETDVTTEIKQIVVTGKVVSNRVLYVEFVDSSTDVYNVGEIGLFTEDDDLFAIESRPNVPDGYLTAKASATTQLVFNMSQTLTNLTTASVTFNSTPTFPPATDTEAGRTRYGTTAEIAARTGNGVVRSDRLPLPSVRFVPAANVAGTANAVTVALSPVATAYFEGMTVLFVKKGDNTGAMTLNVDSLGAKNLFVDGAAATGGEAKGNSLVFATYDGTQFNLSGSPPTEAFSPGAISTELAANAIADEDRVVMGDNSDSNSLVYSSFENFKTALEIPEEFHLHDDVSEENSSIADNDRLLISNESNSSNRNEYIEASNFASYVIGRITFPAPFAVHDVTNENLAPAAADRIVTSDESAVGDPNEWMSLGNLATWVNNRSYASNAQARAAESGSHAVTPANLRGVTDPQSLSDAATIAWNVETAPVAQVTITADRTLGAFTEGYEGFFELIVTADGGDYTLSLASDYDTGDNDDPAEIEDGKSSALMFQQIGSTRVFIGERTGYTL